MRQIGLTSLALAILVVLATLPRASAQQSFTTVEEAAAALVDAAGAGDVKRLVEILGPEGGKLASSGDPVADARGRRRLVDAYADRHSFVRKDDGKVVMIIGGDATEFPVPIIRTDDGWQFDAHAASLDIVLRRIGRNELDAIEVCLVYVRAQKQYAEKDRTGLGAGEYAQRIFSHDGRTDGLYWPSGSGGEQSPLAELVARAGAEGYRIDEKTPFHGYHYRILRRQGVNALGGERDYLVDGRMIGGFALVAFPAEYGTSGIMTFIVNHDGIIFEADLGPQTAALAAGMTSFEPDRSWRKVDAELDR